MSTPKNPVFPKVDPALRFPETERAIIELWKRDRIFEQTVEKPAPKGTFVFYEGPPTANGTPHNGHVLTRAVKDLFPRYKTMRGYHVPRKAGWDTHGLPVEVEVEKELRIHGKAAIEDFGIEPFVRRCIDSVFRYTSEWERLTERIAFWVDLDQAYVTYHRTYVESVWWALSKLLEKGLLYRGHKVVWWWAQGGTALSSAEVGLGYKSVDDPSAFVRFPLRDLPEGAPAGLALAAWTTTPWTLPSNMYAAVKADATYVAVQTARGPVLVAEALAEDFAKKTKGERIGGWSVAGKDLDGLRYEPPFEIYTEGREAERVGTEAKYWRVLVEDFVTLDSGTGIVHIAPAFGEDDNRAFKRLQDRLGAPLELFCAIGSDGLFKDGPYVGRWVKDADKTILKDLEARGVLLHQEVYRHEYPFCWRADDDPLIQFARPAWFIRTTAHKGDAIANNRAVEWLPPHIKEGRMGDFLANNVDWALSRERFWGTPLNVWICERDEAHLHAPASVAEIEERNPEAFAHFHAAKAKDPSLNDHLIVHKPWIDQVTFPCPKCGGTMRRVPEVIDCWFDSGCMPFAQWGFPHAGGSVETLRKAWPADFISEAIDQTRGWFYSLLMISTLVFDDATRAQFGLNEQAAAHPYKTCIVLGHVGDKEGKKESKSKGNYTPPEVILDRVRMEFAIVDDAQTGLPSKPGEAFVAREDLEGLDLQEGAKIRVYRGDLADAPHRELVVRAGKKLPRRVVLLSAEDRDALAAIVHPKGLDVKPVEVPRIAPAERVYLEDPSTPAPGADAFRWFFYASSPPWTNTRHSLTNVRAFQKDFAIKLRNVYSFFTIYANLDGFDPRAHVRAGRPAHVLDRWILSELAIATREITEHMDRYEVYDAAQTLVALTESLSNWYVRRSRDRFWASGTLEENADKREAFRTLYDVLVTIAGLSAPFLPFLSEEIFQGLVRAPFGDRSKASVHLGDWPEVAEGDVDEALSREMADVRAVVSLGLQVRTAAKIKVRKPLASATIIVGDAAREGILRNRALIEEELNAAPEVVGPDHATEYVTFKLKPNFRALGPKIGKHVQAVKKALEAVDAGLLRAELVTKGKAIVPGVEIDGAPLEVGPEDVEVQVLAREGYAAAGDRVGVVVLDTRITPELEAKGLARELLNRVQTMRKESGLAYDDRIDLAIEGPAELVAAARAHREIIVENALCTRIEFEAREGAREIEVEGMIAKIALRKA
jgi:isoleucyl-tRNA synthetase